MTDIDVSPQRLLEETARLAAASLNEFVPPEAQVHLLNAQRELLLAVTLVIEHNAQRSFTAPGRKPAKKRPRQKRPSKIRVD